MAWYRPAQQPAIDAGCRRGKFCFFPRELTAIVVKFMNPKQRAAEAALTHIRSEMVVGLGTGSTADFFLVALADAISQEKLRDIQGVPTSRQSELRARQLDIPLTTLAGCPRPDVTVDGADDVDPALNLIKGLGGALMREKIVAQNSAKLIIIADASKRVNALGEKSPLPVEVAPFAHETHEKYLRDLGCEPALRRTGTMVGDVGLEPTTR